MTTLFTEHSEISPVLQPFECQICSKRFTRLENLKRHSEVHSKKSNEPALKCSHCSKTFSRQDLRLRHVRRKHPQLAFSSAGEPSGRTRSVGPSQAVPDHASTSDVSDNGASPHRAAYSGNTGQETRPAEFDIGRVWDVAMPQELSITLEQEDFLASAPPSLDMMAEAANQPSTWPFSTITALELTSVTIPNVALGVALFFDHVGHIFSFIHRPTFDTNTAPEHLLLGMLCISLLYLDADNHGSRASTSCFLRGRKLLDELEQRSGPDRGLDVTIIQAMVLLGMHAVMVQRGAATSSGLRMHARCVEMSRQCGLPEPLPSSNGSTADLDDLWKQYIRNEQHKRTFFALYQLDCMWYQTLSIPRSVSHLEIKHDMPCADDIWSAPNASAWAHRALVGGRSISPSKFILSVRQCMQGNGPSGGTSESNEALLVMHFICTSMREVSCWSTITGKVDFERFEALHVALKALDECIRRQSIETSVGLTCQATWNMAMIELLLWSPSHTSGVVENGMDAAVAAAVHMSVNQPMTISDQAADSLLPHITWFLIYLTEGGPMRAQQESPWVTFYAFKVCLIVLQLLRYGSRAAYYDGLAKIGIVDDATMVDWIEEVFRLRRRWGVGESVLRCVRAIWCI